MLLAGGQPAVGTEVAVANKDERVFVQSGRIGRNVNILRLTTRADGRFTFPPPDDKLQPAVRAHWAGTISRPCRKAPESPKRFPASATARPGASPPE